MHSSENEKAEIGPAHLASTWQIEDWPALTVFLRNGALQLGLTVLGFEPIPPHGSESRFVHCAFCETTLAVDLRRMRDGTTVCKGMSHGWAPSEGPARPVCQNPACAEFAEFSQAMNCGRLIHLVDWSGGLGGYKTVGVQTSKRGGWRRSR